MTDNMKYLGRETKVNWLLLRNDLKVENFNNDQITLIINCLIKQEMDEKERIKKEKEEKENLEKARLETEKSVGEKDNEMKEIIAEVKSK
jgi:hypothetical protein